MRAQVDRGAVVVGFDGSAYSLAAADAALEAAVQRQVPLRIVHAPRLGHPHSNPPRMPATLEPFLMRVREAFPDLPIEQRMATVPPSWLLLEEAESASMLVLGSHGLDTQDVPEFGSTTKAVQAGALCSVLVVNTAVPRAATAARRKTRGKKSAAATTLSSLGNEPVPQPRANRSRLARH
jgi:nucleotide-binding universal stress UspA family protein